MHTSTSMTAATVACVGYAHIHRVRFQGSPSKSPRVGSPFYDQREPRPRLQAFAMFTLQICDTLSRAVRAEPFSRNRETLQSPPPPTPSSFVPARKFITHYNFLMYWKQANRISSLWCTEHERITLQISDVLNTSESRCKFMMYWTRANHITNIWCTEHERITLQIYDVLSTSESHYKCMMCWILANHICKFLMCWILANHIANVWCAKH